MPGFRLFHHLS